ncbi:MAG: glycine--tRNA ligase [Candidatus Zambryskibacteria bacterium RIFCSPLOWO2_02_FULL_51_21]|uniref:glycine--tRNA ligase n=1 Tax=Candidatus Zambryskibacteria bacterium RIFCSPHIGHO2_02_FULL_43_37 TaxID=1802749 RepID=A0A1G2TG68_9BACT|nr:MAG: glycine--tRNA ligase [Candidatus Zambryskibacteria bacterium RIFCSPHIGHO2_01_FULL_52_18]OHA96296.1 MAG: glycine--tRNA ligase [Candidatus Zambryskibacteria bacterium RIFCSPHIGHO2_02_FULL_43_37]OHB11445.1 MAG: glycine--tRNA ligase [Candidatus Zambryskibacteria bacterium RIFCSPLOWO2_02_FULL_51_21]
MTEKNGDLMEKIVSLCKRRGFIFQGSEIYGGLAGTWDFGPYGAELAYRIKDLWWSRFVRSRDDVYGISSSIIMPEAVWQASGHLKNFTDPIVECKKCHHRFRADHLKDKKKCPDCGGELGEEKTFNLMFPVETGSTSGGTATAYLRGELAQGMFVNFKNIIDTFHPDIPFGIAQVGKAFRNEISPRDFIYRVREFEIAEFEYFVKESDWEKYFEYWKKEMREWLEEIGINPKNVRENDLTEKERAHYSKRTIDFEYQGPIGDMEIQAIAYRTDYDLKNHIEGSGMDLSFRDEVANEKFIPHVIEPTFGVGRLLLAVLLEAYTEDELGGEKRVYLKLNKNIAPVRAAVFPLLKNKPELVAKAREIYANLKKEIPNIEFDDNGNIGKRYRRQDEIGTPYCITIDFDTLESGTVTLRDRDTGNQERVTIEDLKEKIL